MITRAETRYIRISPRKFRQIIPLVKGKGPLEAIAILMNVKKKASVYAIELLKSAVANAKRIQGVDVAALSISRMVANGGPMLKRYRAASMGRASMIRKRTSHIIVELDKVAAKPQDVLEKAHKPEKSEKAPKAGSVIKEKAVHKKETIKKARVKA